jgi:hypothetical protein
MNKIIVRSISGKAREIPESALVNFHSDASVSEYCAKFQLLLTNENGVNSKIVELKEEIEIWTGYKGEAMGKIMGGFIDKIVLSKNQNLEETIEITGRGYESLLFDNKVTGKIQYTEGLSQVVREVLKRFPFNLKGIIDSIGLGVVVFRNCPIIDIIRQICEENNWVFYIDYDKVVHFEPEPSFPKPHTIKPEDIKSYKFVRGL